MIAVTHRLHLIYTCVQLAASDFSQSDSFLSLIPTTDNVGVDVALIGDARPFGGRALGWNRSVQFPQREPEIFMKEQITTLKAFAIYIDWVNKIPMTIWVEGLFKFSFKFENCIFPL